MYEQLELFGPTEGAKPIKRTKSRQEQIEDYEGFLEKFAVKKTTDDCFTPEPVYQAVIDFVRTLTPLDGRTIVRPFYPGGDYETYEYPANCIVIDNPPFSILAKIIKFYDLHGVPFFLFAPELTLFATAIDATYIISGARITYENGAKVPTGFITNVIPDLRLWCCPEIGDAIERAQAAPPPYEEAVRLSGQHRHGRHTAEDSGARRQPQDTEDGLQVHPRQRKCGARGTDPFRRRIPSERQGGSRQGGSREGGSREGGSREGGSREGGSREAGRHRSGTFTKGTDDCRRTQQMLLMTL